MIFLKYWDHILKSNPFCQSNYNISLTNQSVRHRQTKWYKCHMRMLWAALLAEVTTTSKQFWPRDNSQFSLVGPNFQYFEKIELCRISDVVGSSRGVSRIDEWWFQNDKITKLDIFVLKTIFNNTSQKWGEILYRLSHPQNSRLLKDME